MDGYWLPAPVAALVGVCALFLLVALLVRLRRPAAHPGADTGGRVDEAPGDAVARSAAAEPQDPAPGVPEPPQAEWLPAVNSCAASLFRARRAVDAVSSQEARNCLRAVLRRMDAELPNVRVLAELGCSLEHGGPRDGAAVQRVRAQLQDAVHRYALFAEELLAVVEDLVNEPDLERTREHVDALRRQFPLLRPMSEIVAGARRPALAPG
ncbi:hypothetical protein IQ251_10675 [Saccharopolyspora sp. HNM0983]|uniref:Uncharacterized protein n=1 Tax=Saccharopolyspora montiporae TaxID=2781240 RepID=A0A929BCB4_9PSEU|nr:hypothetical protein [Saccharopolyspora sp. HNM0983]MBE9374907.1 hypothetical protein [Saccharopolyspora sp. HNM0983]